MIPFESFRYRDGRLFCEDVDLLTLGSKLGTPFYVYSETAVRENYRILESAFASVHPKICYAVKANSNLSVLKILKEEGASFDIVSGGELFRLVRIGVEGDRIVYSGVGKSASELAEAISQKIFCLAIESVAELDGVREIARCSETTTRISLRLNPDVKAPTHPYISTGLRQHKFGLDLRVLDGLLETIYEEPFLSLNGVGCHIGSQILSVEPFMEAFVRIRNEADKINQRGFDIQHIDIGGGFGVPYKGGEVPLPLEKLAKFLEAESQGYQLVMEPGRFIAANAGALITRVTYRKENHGKNFLIVDAGMNDFIRPTLYQAYHAIKPVRQIADGPRMKVDVVGPVCESADFFAKDRQLPHVRTGETLAILDAGAYGFVAACNYNARPRPAEILVSGDRYRIIRKRESYEDLVRGEEVDFASADTS